MRQISIILLCFAACIRTPVSSTHDALQGTHMSASIIESLSISGSRKSDGSANASGKVWAFLPGTSTTAVLYSDRDGSTVVTQPVILDASGRVPAATAPDGLFTAVPIRLYIEDSSNVVVSDNEFTPATASDVTVDNAAMSGATMDDVLTSTQTSFGGKDFLYQESGGATQRTVKSKFSEIWISVKDFGAAGDGITIDTTAFQAAINRVVALGGGVVYVPPGSYIVDQGLSVSAITGLRFVGAGRATIIQLTHATANLLTFTSPTRCSVENFRASHATSTTGAAFSVAGATDFLVSAIDEVTGYGYGLDASGTSNWTVNISRLQGATRGIRSNSSAISPSIISKSIVGTAGQTAVEINGSGGNFFAFGNEFNGTTGILFNSAYTGIGVRIFGNEFFNTTPISTAGIATIDDFRQWGNGIASATSSAVGAAQTPVLTNGNQVKLTAASGGAGTVTVNAPTTLPATGSTNDDLFWDFVFVNGSGGAVTWSLNGVFKVNAAIPTTDAHTILVRFWWDRANSHLREVSRADTST